jgi:hypothetical protein
MKVNRRATLRILAGVGASSGFAAAQTPPTTTPDADLAAARETMRTAALRIATVNLPRAAEPAFRFRAY